MTRYENLKDEPKKFLSLTGYTKSSQHSCRIFLGCFWHTLKHIRLKGNREKNASIRLTKIVAYRVLKISCSLF